MLIDVSKHQGTIDWNKVKNAGIEGAIIRCGYGSDIPSQDDGQFKRNVEECIRLGIPFGVYLYSYAKSIDEAKSEAAHVLRLIAPYKNKLSYPVYLDLEEQGTENGCIERACVFGDIIENEGLWCGIYANEYWFNHYIGNGLDRFTKWVAKYSDTFPNVNNVDIWQYSSKGHIDGISGNVDVNKRYRDIPAEIRATSKKAVTVGCTVKVLNPVNYDNGKSFKLWYDTYTVIKVDGERAVIGVNGVVTSAIHVNNLEVI